MSFSATARTEMLDALYTFVSKPIAAFENEIASVIYIPVHNRIDRNDRCLNTAEENLL